MESRTLYCADNLLQLIDFPSECVDLIYLDPPFFSNRNYEVIWGDEAEVRSFEDRWEGGIQVYVNWMKERMFELRRVLKPTGSIFLHCDSHASHYLKVMLDEVLGADQFRNEIVWSYKRYTGKAKRFQRLHDTIFFYSRSSEAYFDVPYEPYGGKSGKADSHYKQDEEGKWFRWQKRKGQKPYKIFLAEGRRMGDVWEIPIINASASERLGYPTQKPEALLERIIRSSSPEGGLVLDPFCGCGTTVAVAERLGRQWIGIDISPTAVGLMKRRVEKEGASNINVVGVPVTAPELKELKPFEFQNWVMQQLNGTHSPRKTGDMGIDGFSFMHHDPIQVKQSERVGRNVVDNFETAIERAGKDKGYIVAFSYTRGAYEEAARAKAKKGIDIRLIKITDLLGPKNEPKLGVPELSDMFPQPQLDFLDLPLPEARGKKARPTPDELIESDKASTDE